MSTSGSTSDSMLDELKEELYGAQIAERRPGFDVAVLKSKASHLGTAFTNEDPPLFALLMPLEAGGNAEVVSLTWGDTITLLEGGWTFRPQVQPPAWDPDLPWRPPRPRIPTLYPPSRT